MVEIWMLFSLFLPFLEVVLQSYVNYLRCQEAEDEKAEANHHEALAIQNGLVTQEVDKWGKKIDNRQVFFFLNITVPVHFCLFTLKKRAGKKFFFITYSYSITENSKSYS
jgi:hypothetical protein